MTNRIGDLLTDCLTLAEASITAPPSRVYVSHGAPAVDCLVGSSMVSTERGAVQIADVREGDRVWTWDDGAMALRTVTAWVPKGSQEVFRVRTPRRTIVGTANHRVLRVRGLNAWTAMHHPQRWAAEWVAISDLARGDRLVTLDHLADRGEGAALEDGTPVTPTVAWLLGVLVGDGWVTGSGVCVCVYGELRERVAAAISETWGLRSTPSPSNGLRVSSEPLRDTLTAAGLRSLGPDKRVPAVVWNLPHKLVRCFLDGYMAADGHVDATGHHKFATASEGLARDLRALNIMLGEAVSNLSVQRRTKPIVIKGKTVKNALPLHRFAVYPATRRRHQYQLEHSGARRVIRDPRFGWANVQAVEPVGSADTFDIEVEGTHNFIADGVVAHNCDQLSTYLVDLEPMAIDRRGQVCAVVPVVVAAVELWRCYPTFRDDGSAHPASVYHDASVALAGDGWDLWKGLTSAWAAGTFPTDVPCENVTFRPLEPLLPQGGYAGMRVRLTVQLDGRN